MCAIAAPAAFAVLDDRHAAGRVAGTLFEIETWLGAACALLLFATALVHKPLALDSGRRGSSPRLLLPRSSASWCCRR